MSLRKGTVSAISVQGNPAETLVTTLVIQLYRGTGTVKEQKKDGQLLQSHFLLFLRG